MRARTVLFSTSLLCVALFAPVVSAGCYASHERASDAPVLDAGGCTAPRLPGTPTVLDCPALVRAEEPVVVTLTHTIDACCRPGAAFPSEVRPGRDTPDFGLLPFWSSCDCCQLCGCVGEPTTERVTIGAFDEGTVVGVRAGDLRCSIRVAP